MLSCDRIESAQFIYGTQSLAKLVYYTGWEGWSVEIVQELAIWPYYQMFNAQTKWGA